MNKKTGYIKLWRSIDENPISTRPAYLSVWLFILRNVNHANKNIIWNNEKNMIKRGSFITSASKISLGTGVPRGTVERILKYLKNELMIEEQTTKKFRLISVKNYDKYQSSEEQNEEQVRNKWGTSEEQVVTNKNDNNDKNEKKDTCKLRLRDTEKYSLTNLNSIKGCKNNLEEYAQENLTTPNGKKSNGAQEDIISINGKKSNGVEKINVNKIINEFREINPLIKFENKTQRKAAEDLVKQFGEEELVNMIKWYKDHSSDKYCPVATSPTEFVNKLGAIKIYYQKFNTNNFSIGIV